MNNSEVWKYLQQNPYALIESCKWPRKKNDFFYNLNVYGSVMRYELEAIGFLDFMGEI